MSNDNRNTSSRPRQYEVTGRNKKIDLNKYTVRILGRDIIDYEKLRLDDPKLYLEIIDQEQAAARRSSRYS
ncbi:hypothetical protein CYG49_01925 [Candidatus Saccharibacteria bacterium]|nr:MAG: hypothetical protein CYG49_01925 [Candidatus Saccharibacteria bacterium]